MLGIYKATFGPDAEIPAYCDGCAEIKVVALNIDRDVNYKVLVDPVQDRTFVVNGKSSNYLVTLPTGVVQKELSNNQEKTQAELTTTLLEYCVLEIDDKPVIGKAQVQNIGLVDRRKISAEISNRIPGPQLNDIEVDCPDCNGKVVVPFNLGALFQF